MDVDAVMTELATAVDTIAGLRVLDHPVENINPPMAVVAYPDSIDFDATYGRGMDRMSASVFVVVGNAYARTSKPALTAYMNGSGASSVKAAVESYAASEWHTARVVAAETDVFTMGTIDYISAIFEVDIVGSGT